MPETIRRLLRQRAAMRRAGYRARREYRKQRKGWLRAARLRFAVLAACSLGLILGTHLYFRMLDGDQNWIAGCVTGMIVATFIGLRQAPPGAVVKWQEGAWGEEFTASELAKLPHDQWTVLHDLGRDGRFNFDHVVISDRSVFCLNSKWSTGRLDAADRAGLHIVSRFDDEQCWTDSRVLKRAKGEAASLSALIQKRTGLRCWVEPVVVWWGQYPDGAKSVDGVRLVQGRQLVDRLLNYQEGRGVHRQQIAAALRPGRRRAEAAVKTAPVLSDEAAFQ